MLKPSYIEQLPDRLIELYSQVEMEIIVDMAKRIAAQNYFIPAAQWQYQKLMDMGNYHSFIMEALSSKTGLAAKEIERLMNDAGQKTIKFDSDIYRKGGLAPPSLATSPELQAVLRAGFEQTNGLFENLTKTTANTVTKQFEDVLDRVWLEINSGAFDYNTAIRNAVKDLSDKGLASITYPPQQPGLPGRTDYLDVAVRRATVTGVNQTALRVQDTLADEMGCDLVETTAHAGARPSHAEWQGQVFSRSGAHPKYSNFIESTGYGTGAGLGGWNCRHSFFPTFEGIESTYTAAELVNMNAPKYEYNGKKLTEYEATQMQRGIERNIRKYKREFAGMDAAGQPTEEAAAKLKSWQERQKDFLDKTGLKRQYDRETTAAWSRQNEKDANQAAKRLKNIEQDAIIKTESGNPKRVQVPDEVLKSTVNVDIPNIQGVVPKGTSLTDVYIMAGEKTSVPIRDLQRLSATYNGDVSKWQKKSGDAYGEKFKYVVHWYENDGFAPESEFKLKGVRKK